MECILSLNCGTSSAKYALYDRANRKLLARGAVERVTIGQSFIRHKVFFPQARELKTLHECPNHTEAIRLIFQALSGELSPEGRVIRSLSQITAVGHRVLHGGYRFVKSARITDEVYHAIQEMIDFGPLHNPANLAGIDAVNALLPGVPQVAIFDTAFFQTMPPKAYLYGTPYEWYEKYGLRKYGFHGSSHLYLAKRAAVMLGRDPLSLSAVSLHIGNGISLTAIRDGVAVDHSMGLSPLDGVMMGTRSGSVDPAVITYICQKESRRVDEVVNVLLNRKSGVFGLTGITDMRDLTEKVAAGDERCRLAYDMYCYKIRKYLGAYLAALDYRVDAVVFAGGVGENSWDIRAEILRGFEAVGILVDPELNKRAVRCGQEMDISDKGARVRTLVIPTNEEQVLLEDVLGILDGTYDVHTRFAYSFQEKQPQFGSIPEPSALGQRA